MVLPPKSLVAAVGLEFINIDNRLLKAIGSDLCVVVREQSLIGQSKSSRH